MPFFTDSTFVILFQANAQPVALSCAFSVPVMSHFAALNICQTWNIFACETHLPCMRSQTPFLICPLFPFLLFQTAHHVLCRLRTLTNFFYFFRCGHKWWKVSRRLFWMGCSSWYCSFLPPTKAPRGWNRVGGLIGNTSFLRVLWCFVHKKTALISVPLYSSGQHLC